MVTARYLADITGPMGPVGDLARGTMPANSNANNFTSSGLWYTGGIGTVETHSYLAVKVPSDFFVLASNFPYVLTQFQIPSSPADRSIYMRSKTSSETWNTWRVINYYRGDIPEGTNVYDMRGPAWIGLWDISGGTVAGTLLGTPPPGMAAWLAGQIEVKGATGNSTNLGTITYTPYAPGSQKQQVWTTTVKSFSATGVDAWSGWTNLAEVSGGGGGGGAVGSQVNWNATPASHTARVQAFKDAYPKVSTGNKGVVVFRYDHGLTNFKSMFLPKHREYNLPAYVAMNSRNWDVAENSGATTTEARSWIANDRVEFGNHTADHRDRNTAEGIYDNIVNGRKELETQLNTVIHGFTVPGLAEYNKFEGFGSGYLNNYSDTLAGGLILANHAVCSGVMGPYERPLDGLVRLGSRHRGWEQSDFATVKGYIDTAVSTKTALTLMGHPRLGGLSGYWDATLIDQVLSYVRDLINAGDLADISYYQSHHATL